MIPCPTLRASSVVVSLALGFLGLSVSSGCAVEEEEASVQEGALQAVAHGGLNSPDREVEPTETWTGSFIGDMMLGDLLMKGTVDFTIASETQNTDAWIVENANQGSERIDVTTGQRFEGLKLPVLFHLGSAVGKRPLKMTNIVYHIESLDVANVPSRYKGLGLGPTSYWPAGELGASFYGLVPSSAFSSGVGSLADMDKYVYATIGQHMPGHVFSFEAGAEVFDNYVNGDGCVRLSYGGRIVKAGEVVSLSLTAPFEIALDRTCIVERKAGTESLNDAEAIMKNIKIAPVR